MIIRSSRDCGALRGSGNERSDVACQTGRGDERAGSRKNLNKLGLIVRLHEC